MSLNTPPWNSGRTVRATASWPKQLAREAMLAMIHEVPQVLPRFFGKKQYTALKAEEKDAMDAFFLELMAALGRAGDGTRKTGASFGHDLDLYSEFAAQPVKPAKGRKRGRVRRKIRLL